MKQLRGTVPDILRPRIEALRPLWHQDVLLRYGATGRSIPEDLLRPIDYDFRPASYWSVENLRHLVANIKGAERKKFALRLIDEGRLDEVLLTDSLSEEDRVLQGQLHPSLMGGEYLPDNLAEEVEIARITMASTTQDVISVRARAGIHYRVVDEYETAYTITPHFSKRTLSLRQLVQLIESASSRDGMAAGLCILDENFESGVEPAESLADFLTFSSEFYPDLSKHYWFAVHRWVQRHQNRRVQ